MKRPSLLDQYGRPVRRGVLTEEVGGATLGGVRSPMSGYPADGLNPQRLAAILRAADMGDPVRYMELAETIEERDLHLLYLDLLEHMAEGPQAACQSALFAAVGESKLADLLDELRAHGDVFRHGAPPADLRAALGLPAGFDAAQLLAGVFAGDETALAQALVPVLRGQRGRWQREFDRARAMAERRMERLNRQIAELQRARDCLRRLAAACAEGGTEPCPILATFDD